MAHERLVQNVINRQAKHMSENKRNWGEKKHSKRTQGFFNMAYSYLYSFILSSLHFHLSLNVTSRELTTFQVNYVIFFYFPPAIV